MAADGSTRARAGYLYALAAYGAWGLFPLYWKLLHELPALRILSHRVLWSAVFYLALVLLRDRGVAGLTGLARSVGARWGWILLSATLISINWFTYVYAVNSGQVLESSLGYFINPLINVLIGTIFLKERLKPVQWLALGLAAAGVLVLTLGLGRPPGLALLLATSFGFYGLCRKKVASDPLLVSLLETSVILIPATILLVAREPGLPAIPERLWGWLILGGAVTATPLLWFAEAAKRVPLSTLGFFQYLSPTLQFLLAVLLYREPFSRVHAWSFGLIWAGLGIFTLDLLRKRLLT